MRLGDVVERKEDEDRGKERKPPAAPRQGDGEKEGGDRTGEGRGRARPGEDAPVDVGAERIEATVEQVFVGQVRSRLNGDADDRDDEPDAD
jgi:hypothetical protein